MIAVEHEGSVDTLTHIAVQEEVKNVGGREFPDGTPGNGVPGATAMWGHVWLAG